MSDFLDTWGDSKSTRGRMLIFTDYNEERIRDGYVLTDKIRGIMWGKETCPKTGRIHNQGYVQFYKQTRFTGAMKELNTKCFFAVARGSIEENEEYTSKEGKHTKLGSFCTQGQKLSSIFENYENGNTLYEVAQNDEDKFLRYHTGIEKIYSLCENEEFSKKTRNLENYIIWGDTGTGKTTSILKKYGESNVYILQDPEGDNKYWNDYKGESILLIDDFYSWIKIGVMLKILDNQPYRCRALGKSLWAKWDKVYITSNQNPKEWYIETLGEKRKAFFRRFKKCLEVFKGNNGTLNTFETELPKIESNQEFFKLDF